MLCLTQPQIYGSTKLQIGIHKLVKYINHKVPTFYVQLSDLATDLLINQTSNVDLQTSQYIYIIHKVHKLYA